MLINPLVVYIILINLIYIYILDLPSLLVRFTQGCWDHSPGQARDQRDPGRDVARFEENGETWGNMGT